MTAPSAPQHSATRPPRADLAIAAVLAVLTLLLSTIGLSEWPGITPDEGWVLQAPRNLVRYGLYGTWSADGPLPFDPDVTTGPAVLLPVAAAFAVFGDGLLPARVVVAAYAALAVVAFYAVARSSVDRWMAGLASLLLVLALAPYNRTAIGEVPALFWMLAGGQAWTRSLEDDRRRWGLLAAGCFGLAVLCKLAGAVIAGGALLVAWLLVHRSQRRRADWGALAVPVAGIAVALVAWFGVQAVLLGGDAVGERLAVLAGYRQQNLEPSLVRASRNLAVLTIAVPTWLLAWWAPAVLLTPVLLRTTWREPRRGFWLALFGGCLVFYLLSVGWPRYAFWATAVGTLCIAWLFAPFSHWLGGQPPFRQRVGLGVLAGLLLAWPAVSLVATPPTPDHDAAAMARVLAAAPPEAALGATDWDVDFVTERRFRHPPAFVLPVSEQTLTSQFDWTWPGVDWVVVGQTGRAFHTAERLQATGAWDLLAKHGFYEVYRRR